MKKTVFILMSVLLSLGTFCACGNDDNAVINPKRLPKSVILSVIQRMARGSLTYQLLFLLVRF